MPGGLARVAVRSCALSFALVLAAPTAALADGHNPPGNNGTIKIDEAPPADSGHANRPHPGCAFQLRMFGFDDEQYGTVTFVGQAPTKLGALLTQQHVLLSDDDAGGGQDVDAVYSYTAAQLGLVGQPQAKQGWHVKVTVDADDAPGGAKQKVFWLSCPTATTSGGTASGTAAQAGSNEEQAELATKSLTSTAEAGTVTAGAMAGVVRAAGAGGTTAATATEAPAGAGLGATSAPSGNGRGSALPFTGFALAAMLAFGLAALVAGTLAVLGGRRRTAGLSSSR